MTEFILHYKWLFLIMGEIIFWVSLFGFFIVRYALGWEKLSKYFIFLWLFSDAWLLILGIMDYRSTGTFDTFQVVILIFLFYAVTFGRNDMRRLDRWMKRTIKKWKGEPPDEAEKIEKLSGMSYAIMQGKEFALHVAMFAAVIAVLSFFMDFRGFNYFFANGSGDIIETVIKNGWFVEPTVGKITGVWTLILIIDAVITVSYFIIPKKA
ncbi:hypothetical protein D4T97_001260 [Siminovitchia acidinfaciens]|uniref:Uncharacterized protein n=1 Tax=Siminovitchia acidinfaciens TaxID=2321395 RepID=A0A429Y6Y1_9BACI|nr:hypothetical protein [Siminovitchia acidinfaciens]RST77155.1 hypothetical protein D4T97_001260 [Siminovitchia acidinfaciens]